MHKLLALILGITTFLFFSSCSTYHSINHRIQNVEVDEVKPKLSCFAERGALDIGSGSTKFIYAKVDICKNQVLEVLAKQQFALKFKEHLSYNNGLLKEDIFQAAIQQLNPYFKSLGVSKKNIRAVATEVFREAHNGEEFIQRLSHVTGIHIHLISQEDEALLGFKGAEAITGKKADQILVWDIGGGSMQMTSFKYGGYDFYKGKLASVSLKTEVLKWQGKDRGSPNPLGPYVSNKAVYFSEEYANKNVPTEIKEAIEQGKEVIGIGGVHFFSIKDQLKLYPNTPYSLFQLEQALDKRANFHDHQFEGEYKETEATNLALVLGHMKALKIRTVLPVKVNLGTGLLFTDRMW